MSLNDLNIFYRNEKIFNLSVEIKLNHPENHHFKCIVIRQI